MQEITNIKDFETQFVNVFQNEVAPKIKQFNIDREKEKEKIEKNSKWIYIFFGIIEFIYIAFCIIFTSINLKIALGIVFSAILAQKAYSLMLKKNFESKLKERIMPVLMQAFGNFRWVREEIISLHEIAQAKMFKITGDFSKIDDDCFVGSYKNVPIKISESLVYEVQSDSNDDITQYNGIYILLEIPKKFKGHTVVTIPQYKKAVPYEEVKLEDVEFSKMFYVGSTDQVEARYLLTTAFMQRFKNIQKMFGGEYITCSFLYSSLLIFVPTDKDLFSIGDLDEDVADPKQFNTMLKELISIFELIEELKLYQNTGL